MKNYTTVLILSLCSFGFSQTTILSDFTVVKGTQVSVLKNLIISSMAKVINDGELTLKSNLINNGILNYSLLEQTGKINFTGIDQQISGTETTFLYNVLFNNNTTNVEGALQIDNDADFTKGIVNNRDYGGILIFNELSDHLNVSNISFVEGTIVKRGYLSFSFPIGANGFYRSLSIESLENSNSFSSSYFQENSNDTYPHNKKVDLIDFIDTEEYWGLKQTEGNDFVIVELTRNDQTSSSEISNASLDKLHIVRWDPNNELWIDEGGIVNTADNSIKTVSEISGYGVYALATIVTDVIENLIIYNNLTPNGDGLNDAFIISGIELYPENTVEIFNRWGVSVSKIHGYNNKDKVFMGLSDSSLTYGTSTLPAGTYYYVLKYMANNKELRKINYLYINGE